MALTVTEIQQLYTAYLGRPADREGLEYWQETGISASELRANLANDEQPEYVELYGDRTREEVITAIYENMFGRTPDEAGLAYWLEGEGAEVPESELQHLFIEAASEEDRDAFNARVAEDVSNIPEPGEPSTTIYKEFTDIAGRTDLTQNIEHVGKEEWDAAGRVVTTSKDYTFTLANQLGEGETYQGLFLSPLLTADTITSNSQLFIELLDVRSAGTPDSPLANLPIDGFRFNLDGEPVALRDNSIFAAETYEELRDAINAVIAETPELAGFNAEIGANFTATDGDDPIPGAVGRTIVLTDANGREISGGAFLYTDQETGGFTLYGDLSTEAPESDQLLIETNLELDNIGYGSQGGTVNLVGESASDKGIEKINLTAENGVWLTRLESQANGNHFLKEVSVDGDDSYLHIGAQDNENVVGLAGLLTTTDGLDNAGLVDVQNFNGGDFGGNIKLSAFVSEAVIERDLQSHDTQDDPAAEDITYAYQTAGGDDQISLVVHEDLLARADAQVVVNAGNGNNVVETVFVNDEDQLINQQLNGNITITTGSGDDVVRTWGGGDAVINTGGGNDVIYADNSGLIGGTEIVADFWEFNSTAAAGGAPTEVSNSDNPLSAGASEVGQTFNVESNANVQVQVTFKGFESIWVNVPTTRTSGDNEDTITTLQVNQAIKNAVNNDAVLQNLIEAFDGNGNILNIQSLIDGDNLDQLEISFRDNNEDTSADLEAIEAIYGAEDTASNAVAGITAGGGESLAESDNVINAGAGNDVIVLGTGANSNDTIVLEGNFGTNTIVNFEAGPAADVTGYDILDFSDYGVNGSGLTIGGDYNVVNDEVNVLDFAGFGADVTFANLTAADVKARIGDSVDNGRIDSIILVHNGDNAGEYKAFDVNSANNSTDFTVDLIGVLDFGENLSGAFTVDNFA